MKHGTVGNPTFHRRVENREMRPESVDTIRIDPENHNQVNTKPTTHGVSTTTASKNRNRIRIM